MGVPAACAVQAQARCAVADRLQAERDASVCRASATRRGPNNAPAEAGEALDLAGLCVITAGTRVPTTVEPCVELSRGLGPARGNREYPELRRELCVIPYRFTLRAVN